MENTNDIIAFLTDFIHNWILDHGYTVTTAKWLGLGINLIIATAILFLIDQAIRKVVVRAFLIFTNKSKTTFDDHLVKSNFPKYIAHIIPFIIIKNLIPYIFNDFITTQKLLLGITDIYLILLVLFILRSIIRSVKNYLWTLDRFKDKPLDSYAQVVLIFVWFIGIVVIFSELTGLSILKFITTLGAASAILLLVFRDTILGFVASIQTSANDMVRIGDWITMEKYGADGDVIEINLATVKVQNFDKTITTIPTYALISDSFKNWRGMQKSGGRRIKRAINIKTSSVRFLNDQDLKKFQNIQGIQQYILERQMEIESFNKEFGFDKKKSIVNGRNQTNLGLFRKYVEQYLQNHPNLHKELSIMTRHLAPTAQGIPLEIYAFTTDIRWVYYEGIMADIFEHIIAAAPHFELEVFENLSGSDVQKIFNKMNTREVSE